jgi:hypothetical protein
MKTSGDIERLADLAQLMLDHRLGQLRASTSELERSRMQLLSVNQAAQPAGLDPVTAEKIALTYDRWADRRRSELNLVIARQTVNVIEARGAAQTAFGRVQALQGLATRLKRQS